MNSGYFFQNLFIPNVNASNYLRSFTVKPYFLITSAYLKIFLFFKIYLKFINSENIRTQNMLMEPFDSDQNVHLKHSSNYYHLQSISVFNISLLLAFINKVWTYYNRLYMNERTFQDNCHFECCKCKRKHIYYKR